MTPPGLLLRLASVAVVLLALYGLYWSIDSAGYSRGKAEIQAKWDKDSTDQAAKEAAQSTFASQRLEDGNAKQKIVYRTITQTVDRIVDRPVYRNVCLDAVGVCIASSALNGTPADSCEPDSAVRAVDAAR